MKKAMVIGGAGFIGSHLVDALIERDVVTCVADNLFLGKPENVNPAALFAKIDACKFEDLAQLIYSFNPDVIYNMAVMPLPHSLSRPFGNVQINIQIVQNLCEIILRAPLHFRLIQCSSSEVYGSAQYEPMCENHPWKASTPYAASKAAGDLICLSYVKTFGCNISIIRPFNNYGPRQNAGSYAGVIPLTIDRLRKGKKPVIYGDGFQTRDYIYVKDTARAAVLMGYRDDLKGEVINIGAGHDYSIIWLVHEIMGLMRLVWSLCGDKAYSKIEDENGVRNIPYEIDWQPSRPGDVRRHIANVLKAKDLIGFEHTTPMDEGLKETIKWYLDH